MKVSDMDKLLARHDTAKKHEGGQLSSLVGDPTGYDSKLDSILAKAARLDAAFEESKHPRGEGGQFTSGGGLANWDKFKGYTSKHGGYTAAEYAESHPQVASEYEKALASSEDPFEQRKAVLKTKKRLLDTTNLPAGPVEGMAEVIIGHHKANYGAAAPKTAQEARVARMTKYLAQKPAGHL